jgi:hypothetical protein
MTKPARFFALGSSRFLDQMSLRPKVVALIPSLKSEKKGTSSLSYLQERQVIRSYRPISLNSVQRILSLTIHIYRRCNLQMAQ